MDVPQVPRSQHRMNHPEADPPAERHADPRREPLAARYRAWRHSRRSLPGGRADGGRQRAARFRPCRCRDRESSLLGPLPLPERRSPGVRRSQELRHALSGGMCRDRSETAQPSAPFVADTTDRIPSTLTPTACPARLAVSRLAPWDQPVMSRRPKTATTSVKAEPRRG
jgi:hypothetical protein